MLKQNSTIRIDLKKLFGKEAVVGGYYLNQSNRSGIPLEICFKGEQMVVPSEDLKKVFRKGNKLFKPKFGAKEYYLYYVTWSPGTKGQNQNKLFDENRTTRK